MTRDLPGFNLRMPPEIKKRLEKEAKLNGRSLSAEILNRLTRSVENRVDDVDNYRTRPGGPEFIISDSERRLLHIFKTLPVEKQLALLALMD